MSRPAKSDSEDEDDFLGMAGSGAGGSYFTEPGAQVNQQYKKVTVCHMVMFRSATVFMRDFLAISGTCFTYKFIYQ